MDPNVVIALYVAEPSRLALTVCGTARLERVDANGVAPVGAHLKPGPHVVTLDTGTYLVRTTESTVVRVLDGAAVRMAMAPGVSPPPSPVEELRHAGREGGRIEQVGAAVAGAPDGRGAGVRDRS